MEVDTVKVKDTASSLYQKHGLQKASFLAFHNLQESSEDEDFSFWLHVINTITAMDVLGESEADYTQQQ